LDEKGILRDFEVRWTIAGRTRVNLVGAELIELHGSQSILTVVTDVTERRQAEQDRIVAAARDRRAQEDFTQRLLASQEAERRRIAGELHDSLGQDLLLIKNRLQLALMGAPLPAELKQQLEAVQVLATQAVAEVRRISHALRPSQLDHLGLTRALRAMLDSVARTAGFKLIHRIENVDGLFRPEAEANWYRIVQEGMNNILKHAQARQVEVVLEHDVHSVRMILADDGCGFSAPLCEPEGLGLRHIAERARILGGRSRVDSSPGTGTRIEIEVPLPTIR
jgi:signal transduction histidine kinase